MTDKEQRWTVHIEEDAETGDLILPLPPDLLSEVGWLEGDTLTWTDLGDGRWQLSRKE